MKKIFIFMLLITLFFPGIIIAEKNDKNPVNIYIFRGDGCPYCENALKYFKDPQNMNSDIYVIKDYEVWNNKDNNALAVNVAECFGEKLNGVPYIVVGKSYHKSGFITEMAADIINAANKEYKNSNYIDIVKSIEEGNTKYCVNSIENYPTLEDLVNKKISFLNDIF